MHYLARVTIHNGSYDEYETLHASMKALGFVRYIRGAKGSYYWLPDATYVGESANDGPTVREQISRAAAAAAPSKAAPEVVLTVRGESWWSGLRVAK